MGGQHPKSLSPRRGCAASRSLRAEAEATGWCEGPGAPLTSDRNQACVRLKVKAKRIAWKSFYANGNLP